MVPNALAEIIMASGQDIRQVYAVGLRNAQFDGHCAIFRCIVLF